MRAKFWLVIVPFVDTSSLFVDFVFSILSYPILSNHKNYLIFSCWEINGGQNDESSTIQFNSIGRDGPGEVNEQNRYNTHQ